MRPTTLYERGNAFAFWYKQSYAIPRLGSSEHKRKDALIFEFLAYNVRRLSSFTAEFNSKTTKRTINHSLPSNQINQFRVWPIKSLPAIFVLPRMERLGDLKPSLHKPIQPQVQSEKYHLMTYQYGNPSRLILELFVVAGSSLKFSCCRQLLPVFNYFNANAHRCLRLSMETKV